MAAVPHLLDSNAFLRLAKRDDPEHALVKTAIERFNGLCTTI
jgi:predicted nucleic acid-binding protein